MSNFLTLIISTIILIAVLKIFIKLLPLLLIVALSYFLFKQFKKPGMVQGQTYKQCGHCKKKAERNALSCDFCGKSLE
ncbi:MAG: hypothetical protein A2Y25_09645 [Candidatus Melainabacteria bacterium GWF2_37_15]|nr:MAG: hypothetical protein A2Y25_09645 [Candidatus Melainabacteria bacterium GWF2_37_15]